MAIKLTVLSGSMQGHVLETNKTVIRLGANADSEIAFDVASDPEIQGQQVSFELRGDRWRLCNDSTQSLFVNQDLVRDATGLRSGDLVRLSQDGPDVLFELTLLPSTTEEPTSPDNHSDALATNIEKQVAKSSEQGMESDAISTPLPVTAETVTAAENVTAGENTTPTRSPMPKETSHATRKTGDFPATRRKSPRRRSKVATLVTLIAIPAGGIAGICIAVMLLWVIWKKDPLGVIQPNTATQQDLPALDDSAVQAAKAVKLDQTETDVAKSNRSKPLNATNEQLVELTKSPPTRQPDEVRIKAFELKRIDLSVTPSLVVDLSKNVVTASGRPVRYHRDDKTPLGLTIDPNSGLLTWTVPQTLAGQEIDLPFLVSVGKTEEIIKRGSIKVQIISGSSATESNRGVLDSIYLLVTQTTPGNLYLPLGTACSIDRTTLLTSATVAMGLFDAQKRGWKIMALQTPNGTGKRLVSHEISEVKAHSIYLNANHRTDREGRIMQQAYFDLAIVRTAKEIETPLSLRQTSERQVGTDTFVCIGYSIDGKAIRDPSKLTPSNTSVELIARIPPVNADVINENPPLLLQFEGEVPRNIFGGIILNADSDVVGVYSFEAELPAGANSPGAYYATESLPARSLLNDMDRNEIFWMSLDEHARKQ